MTSIQMPQLGETIVEGKSFPWARGDMLVVPSWLSHHHRASSDAVLFRVTDTPTPGSAGFGALFLGAQTRP